MGKVNTTKPRLARPYSKVLAELVPFIAEIEADEESEFTLETYDENDLTVDVTMRASVLRESKLLMSHGAEKLISDNGDANFLIVTGIECALKLMTPDYQEI